MLDTRGARGLVLAAAGCLAAHGLLAVGAMQPLTVAHGRPGLLVLTLGSGDYVHLTVACDRSDLALTWLGPDGTPLLAVNERPANDRAEELEWVAASAGDYRLEVSTASAEGCEATPELRERRPATTADRERAAALATYQRLVADAVDGGRPGAERAIAALPELVEALGHLGEPARALRARLLAARALQDTLRRPAEARPQLFALIDGATAAGDIALRALALQAIATGYWREGKFDDADPYARRAVADARESADRYALANSLALFATISTHRGETATARSAYQESIALQRSLGRDSAAANAELGLGNLLFRDGDLGAALEAYEGARDEFRRLGDSSYLQLAGLNIGAALGEMGNFERAVTAFDQALAAPAGKESDRTRAGLWVNRGNALEELERWDDAAQSYRRAEQAARQGGFEDILSKVVKDRGGLALRRGDLAGARPLLEESLALARASGAHARLAAALDELGELERLDRHLERSAELLQEASRLADGDGLADKQVRSCYLLALLHRDRGDLDPALATVRSGIAATERVRARLADEGDRAAYLASVHQLYQLQVALELALERRDPGVGHVAAAFAAAEQGRARMLIDLLDPSLLDPAELGRERPAARSAATDNPPSSLLAARTPLDPAALARLLPADAALLEYVIGPDSAVLLVVHQSDLRALDLGPSRAVAEAVRDLSAELEQPRILGAQRYRERAARLFDLVVRPALPYLARVRQLIVSPDGPLYRIPLATLVTDRDQGSGYGDLAYLGARFEISRAPSATLLAALDERARRRTRGEDELVAFGDPAPPGSPQGGHRTRSDVPLDEAELLPLPASRREVERIGRIFPGAATFVGAAASEQRYKNDPRVAGARILHLAAHGIPNDREPMLSAIVLAPGDASQDGLLQAHEIAGLTLHADLVTLSACRSALGRELAGEGFVGLTQAFLEAGASSVLATLQPVSDVATSELMTRFYEALRRGEPAARALASAQRALRRRGDFAHPAFWAPFVLVGAPPPG